MTTNKQGLQLCQGLTQEELSDIEALANLCNKNDKSDLKLNWNILRSRRRDQVNDFLYYENGLLVGYLALFSFNPREGEISGMVHPGYRRRGIFTQLFQAAEDECRRRGIPQLLLIVGHSYRAGQAFAKARDIHYHHSEYKMFLKDPKASAKFTNYLQFRPARSEDLAVMTHITAVSFDLPEDEINWYSEKSLEDPARRFYIGLLDDVYVGKIEVSLTEQEASIYGFGILPAYRGRGYGREMLARTVQEILATGQSRIVLEVATENKRALSLYQSCGFREMASYDYYSYNVPKA
jgi:ribosomal protein S18 acetylase RimI-like enzyme